MALNTDGLSPTPDTGNINIYNKYNINKYKKIISIFILNNIKNNQ